MSRIYISYRRTDAGAYAGRLFDDLNRRLGRGLVFMDIQGSIGRGQDFAQAINAALNTCDVALVIIGNHWVTSISPEGNHRLDDPNDWVRIETAAVLRRNVLVIPVLVDGAHLPDPADLPEELRPLCRRNACELTDSRWSYDVGELVKDIEKFVRPIDRMKILGLKDKALHWPAGAVTAVAALFGIGILVSAVVWFNQSNPEAVTTAAKLNLTSNNAERGSQTGIYTQKSTPRTGAITGGETSVQKPTQGGLAAQPTRSPGVVAELARFVRAESLITAEVVFKNTGIEPAKFCLGSWELIDEKTGHTSYSSVSGGDINCYVTQQTLAPAETYVAWAKFKWDAPSTSKYSLYIDKILNYPFEELLPQPTQGGLATQPTRSPGVVAELARFVRAESLITAEVVFKNTSTEPAKFCLGSWELIDEKTGQTSYSSVSGGDINCYVTQQTLAPAETYVAWAKFKSDASSTSKYSLYIENILNRPFEELALTSSK